MTDEHLVGQMDPPILPTVLLVEDDNLQSRMVERQLRGVAQVITCSTQEEAITLFVQHPNIALILLDGCVPGFSLNTIPLLQQFRMTFTGPIVAMSGNRSYRQIMMEHGCTHECGKSDVGYMVRSILGIRHTSTTLS